MRFPQKNGHRGRAKSDQPPPPQRSQRAIRIKLSQVFPKAFRILKRNEYRAIAHERNRFVGDVLLIDSHPSEFPRLGITAPRSFGNAVRRNRFKRLVREVFRTHRKEFPPVDLVVLPKKGANPLSLEIITKDLLQFINELKSTATARC